MREEGGNLQLSRYTRRPGCSARSDDAVYGPVQAHQDGWQRSPERKFPSGSGTAAVFEQRRTSVLFVARENSCHRKTGRTGSEHRDTGIARKRDGEIERKRGEDKSTMTNHSGKETDHFGGVVNDSSQRNCFIGISFLAAGFRGRIRSEEGGSPGEREARKSHVPRALSGAWHRTTAGTRRLSTCAEHGNTTYSIFLRVFSSRFTATGRRTAWGGTAAPSI